MIRRIHISTYFIKTDHKLWGMKVMDIGIKNVSLFKQAMGNYPTGVTVVTAFDKDDNPIGLTVNSFASVSLDPLLILWSIDKKVFTYEIFKKIDKFAVNILAADQKETALLFATRDVDRFGGSDWEKSAFGLPVLANTLATLECKTFKTVEAGDHTILIGEVMALEVEEKDPLLYHARNIGPFPNSFHEKD